MACFMTQMELKLSNSDDYRIAEEWCDRFNENDEIKVFEPECDEDTFEISYDELDIDDDEARDTFKAFAHHMISEGVSGPVEVHFCIEPDNCGEETHLLFMLKDGKATEQYAYADLSEMDEDELDDWRFDPKYESPCSFVL
ncbi:MAG: hypothetical protein LUC95_02190 [Lachnospiraceae bacterium]|nr:hypothetical protein [Lachnospiraceae bacterium]